MKTRIELSISELSQLTRKERRTIITKLQGVPYVNGAKGAMLYDSVVAFERIYSTDRAKFASR